VVPPAARLRAALPRWQLASKWAARIVQHGLIPLWLQGQRPPLILKEDSYTICLRYGGSHLTGMKEEIDKLIKLGSVREVTDPREKKGEMVLSIMFPVGKKDGRTRPVINLKTINPFIEKIKFKMEGLRTVADLLRKDWWMCKVDLADAFHHISLHPQHQRYFRFRWQSKMYQWVVMPFGYRDAPRIFTKMMGVIAKEARARGLCLVVYMDDVLLMAPTKEAMEKARDVFLQLLKEFGLTVNYPKSHLEPTQLIEFLGVMVDSRLMSLSLPPRRLDRVQTMAATMLKKCMKGKPIHLHDLQKLLGNLQSVTACVLPTRLNTNALIEMLRSAEFHPLHLATAGPSQAANLRWWLTHLPQYNGRPLLPPPPGQGSGYGRVGEGVGSGLLLARGQETRLPGLLHLPADKQQSGAASDQQRSAKPSASPQMERLLGAGTHRQQGLHGLHQPDGRQGAAPHPGDGGNTQLLPSPQHTADGGVPTGRGERDGRHAVAHQDQPIRGDAASRPLPPSGSGMGPASHGLLRVEDEHAVPRLREPTARHLDELHRFLLENGAGPPQDAALGLPPLPAHSKTPTESGTRGADNNRPTAGVAGATVVASLAPVARRLPATPTRPPSAPLNLGGGRAADAPTSLVVRRFTALGRALEAQGIPSGALDVANLAYKHGETGTTLKEYDSAWLRWHDWCRSNDRSATSLSFPDVLAYLLYMREEGKSAAQIKKAMSMLSASHKLLFSHQPDYRALSDATLLLQMRKGVVNEDAKLPVYKPWFSLASLFGSLAGLATNTKSCKLDELRDKAIILMRLDTFCRAADLASVDWPDIQDDSLTFYFYDTKTKRSSRQTTIHAYKPNPAICTVSVVRAYCSRTAQYQRDTRPRNINGTIKQCRPLFVTSHKNATKDGGSKTHYTALSSQRIAKVTKERMHAAGVPSEFTGHNTRGAAASKAFNLGLPLVEVLRRGGWKSEDTFMNSYFRPVRYRPNIEAFKGWSIEQLIRHTAARY